jgi:predicted alpha/beta superfamily hydrolase
MKSFLVTMTLLFSMTALAEPVKYADSLMIESSAFDGPREIMISLPKSYVRNKDVRYPVIYTVRGQLDLLSVVAAIDMLAAEAPEFIVVGISGAGSEFIPDGEDGQSKYSQLLHNEVVPYIEGKFRTAPYSILIGHSAAGKFVTNDWLSRGNDFSSYYAISPELHDGAINARVTSIAQKTLSSKSPLLVSMGNEGRRMQSLFDELEKHEALSPRVNFIRFEDQTHMSGRVNTVMAGIRGSFANWRPSKKVESGKFGELRAHYLGLSERYGYEIEIPLETMKRESAFHCASDIEERWQVASDIVKYAVSRNADNADEFFDISDEMVGYGMADGSKRLTSFVCEQSPKHRRCDR